MAAVSVVLALSNLADNSRFARALSGIPELEVVCRTADLAATYAFVEERTPNAVVISSALAAQPEFEVMRALFATFDVRWLVIRDAHCQRGRHQSTQSDLFEISVQTPITEVANSILSITRSRRRSAPAARVQPSTADFEDRIILIGASTGGIDALLTVLRSFPANCPPTLIVQHTGSGFGNSLAALLDRQCPPKVIRAENAAGLSKGQIILAAGCLSHLELTGPRHDRVKLTTGTSESGHMPSIDVLFRSTLPVAKKCVAALLTGMGRDGAAGLRQLRDRGARTISQDEATSVVYGMPKAAVELGGAQSVLPLPAIGKALIDACRQKNMA